ncbi:Putative teichuronic acid biosynthesis glycosyltransferase TuaG [Ruegeria denitrificans]|uniref:Putative teichuronic acid biosynthesis glycosyltransferase TuaG n=1 Tax=Ruegeria denitrificans TaxID=1715692 RepID=A0A0P1IAX5_9RHOB|nr:glycosyltransferase [Ruegeria denitrificans]CUK02565.1 Putative teichuronic acid biosynthesis glycosyltransferase TuaG [Ruegeria denitrificans]
MKNNDFDPFWFRNKELCEALRVEAAFQPDKSLPRITVVTPAFRSGKYIRDTVESVYHQFYPNLEYLVYDSCSDDGTAEILSEYSFLDATIEKDNGQSDALNKGFKRATGDIITWLNADDIFAPWALWRMAMAFEESGADLVAGQVVLFSGNSSINLHTYGLSDGPLIEREILNLDGMWNTGQYFYQPEVFFTRDIYEKAGGYISENLHYSMDYELWLRMAGAGAKISGIGAPITYFRKHDEQKTHAEKAFKSELKEVVRNYVPKRNDPPVHPGYKFAQKRPRVVMINDLGFQYGAGVGHRRIAEALRLQHCDVHCFSLAEDASDENLTIIRDYESLVLAIEALDPDVVIIGNLHGAERKHIWLSAVLDRWKTLFCLHDFYMLTGRCAYPGGCAKAKEGTCDATCPTPLEYPKLEPGKISAALSRKRNLIRHPNAMLLANSEYTKKVAGDILLGSGFSEREIAGKILLAELGINTQRFFPASGDEIPEMRKSFGIPLEKRVILMPSGDYDDPRKGGAEAWSLLQKLPADQFHALVIGRGVLPKGLQQDMVTQVPYAKDLDRIADYFRISDFVLTASCDETFGQTIVEGALCGAVPISLGGGGALPEVCSAIKGSFQVSRLERKEQAIKETVGFLLGMANDPGALAERKLKVRLTAENKFSLGALSRRLHLAFKQSGIISERSLFPKVDLGLNTNTPPVTVLAGQISFLQNSEIAWTPDDKFNLIAPRWLKKPGRFESVLTDKRSLLHLALRYPLKWPRTILIHRIRRRLLRLSGK